jgi:hypothetical protein
MAERPFAEQLARECESWVADGLVTAEQAAAIRARYAEPEDARSRTAAALSVVGAVVVGVGVIAFFAANWDGIPKPLRLVLLVAGIALAYLAAYELRDRRGTFPHVGAALYLLGAILFGSALFLVGQMYNVEAHDPFALLVWAVGTAALAAVVRTPPLTWATVAIFTAWTAWEACIGIGGDEELASISALAIPYGAALYGAGTFVRERVGAAWVRETDVDGALRGAGLLFAAFGLFLFTFLDPADDVAGAARGVGGGLQALAVVLVLAALAAAAAVAVSRRRSAAYEAGAIVAVAVATAGALFGGGNGTVWAIAFNLLFAGLALGAIAVGYVNEEPWLVNAGVVLVAIDLVARYFDFFWDALGRSLGLIGSGLVVLALAWGLERQRKRVLARMDA